MSFLYFPTLWHSVQYNPKLPRPSTSLGQPLAYLITRPPLIFLKYSSICEGFDLLQMGAPGVWLWADGHGTAGLLFSLGASEARSAKRHVTWTSRQRRQKEGHRMNERRGQEGDRENFLFHSLKVSLSLSFFFSSKTQPQQDKPDPCGRRKRSLIPSASLFPDQLSWPYFVRFA